MIWHGLLLTDEDLHIERVDSPQLFADWLRDENRPRREIEAALFGLVIGAAWVESRINREFPGECV